MSCDNTYNYINGGGFGHVSSEALPDALPKSQNNPQLCPYGLYCEQLSGSAFTAPRHKNVRTWQYRIRPSVSTTSQHAVGLYHDQKIYDDFSHLVVEPKQLRWSPSSQMENDNDFVSGLQLMCGAGDPGMKDGLSIYTYSANTSMSKMRVGDTVNNRCMANSDGDMLIVLQTGALIIKTELGVIQAVPCEIVVIPRGVKFTVDLEEDGTFCRGYVCEVFNGHFELPQLGPIGANGLANPRDFQIPTAAYEDIELPPNSNSCYQIIQKFQNKFFESRSKYSPFDVVAWHGNYYPFKYDLRTFCCMNSVTFDHPDPSIYTVLTCVREGDPGVAVADFVIFPPRWMVAEHTFRPPYFHRNCMSEYMGMVYGKYDAKAAHDDDNDPSKPKSGFLPGGSSLHSVMIPHGPDVTTFIKASTATPQAPVYFEDGLAFMFESNYLLKVAPSALESPLLQPNYSTGAWKDFPKLFTGEKDVTFPPPPEQR